MSVRRVCNTQERCVCVYECVRKDNTNRTKAVRREERDTVHNNRELCTTEHFSMSFVIATHERAHPLFVVWFFRLLQRVAGAHTHAIHNVPSHSEIICFATASVKCAGVGSVNCVCVLVCVLEREGKHNTPDHNNLFHTTNTNGDTETRTHRELRSEHTVELPVTHLCARTSPTHRIYSLCTSRGTFRQRDVHQHSCFQQYRDCV